MTQPVTNKTDAGPVLSAITQSAIKRLPRFCPFCGKSRIEPIRLWNCFPQDEPLDENSPPLEEFQCRDCEQESFWVGAIDTDDFEHKHVDLSDEADRNTRINEQRAILMQALEDRFRFCIRHTGGFEFFKTQRAMDAAIAVMGGENAVGPNGVLMDGAINGNRDNLHWYL